MSTHKSFRSATFEEVLALMSKEELESTELRIEQQAAMAEAMNLPDVARAFESLI